MNFFNKEASRVPGIKENQNYYNTQWFSSGKNKSVPKEQLEKNNNFLSLLSRILPSTRRIFPRRKGMHECSLSEYFFLILDLIKPNIKLGEVFNETKIQKKKKSSGKVADKKYICPIHATLNLKYLIWFKFTFKVTFIIYNNTQWNEIEGLESILSKIPSAPYPPRKHPTPKMFVLPITPSKAHLFKISIAHPPSSKRKNLSAHSKYPPSNAEL